MLSLTATRARASVAVEAHAPSEPTAASRAERLREWLLIGLVVLVPLAWNPLGVLGFETTKVTAIRIAAVALFALTAVEWLTEHRRPLRLMNGASITGAVFLSATAFATMFSVDWAASLYGGVIRLGGLLTLASLLIVGTTAAGSRRPERLVDAALLASLPVSAYAIVQQARLDPLSWLGTTLGPASTVGSSTALGGYLAMLLPLTLARGWQHVEDDQKRAWPPGSARYVVLLGAAAALEVIALFCTGVRGALVGALAGLLCLAVLLHRRGEGRELRLRLAIVAGLGAVAIVLLNVSLPARESGRAASASVEPLAGFQVADPSARERLLLWQAAIQRLAGDPSRIPLGYGPETTVLALEPVFPVELARRLDDMRADRVHDLFLEQLLTTGVVGLLAYLGFLGAIARSGLRVLGRSASPWLPVGAVSAIVAHHVEAAVAFPTATTSLLFFLFAGLISAWDRELTAPAPALQQADTALQPLAEPRLRLGFWLALPAVSGISLMLAAAALLPIVADTLYSEALRHVGSKDMAGAARWSQAAWQTYPPTGHYALAAGLLTQQLASETADPGQRTVAFDQAERALRETVATVPGDPYGHLSLASLLTMRAEAERQPSRQDEVVTESVDAVRLAPDRPTIADAAADLALQASRPDLALTWTERARTLDDDNAERLARRGEALLLMGQFQTARESLEQASSLAPRSPEAHAGLAHLAMLEADATTALEHARQAARLRQRDWRYRERLAALEMADGDARTAVVEARAAARFAPPWETARLRTLVEQYRAADPAATD